MVREESNFGAVAGEAVLPTMTCILYFVEIPILVCILYYIIQLPGCQNTFITVNYSQVISLRGKLDTSLGGSDDLCIIFYLINNIKYKKYFMVEFYLCFDLHLTVHFPNLDIPRFKFWLNTRFTLKKDLLCLV